MYPGILGQDGINDRQSSARVAPRCALSADEAAEAIEEIVADALAHLDAERFWPAHPLDDRVSDGNTSFYFGATGVMWALDYLGRVDATKAVFDFRPFLPRLIQANRAEFAK